MTNRDDQDARRASQRRKGSAAGKYAKDVEAMLARRADADRQIRAKVRAWIEREKNAA